MIKYSNEYVWQSYSESECLENSISNLNKIKIVFASDDGSRMVNSDPERASLGFSFDDISCGGGYIIYSNEVPYDATNIIASDYMEDAGRILLNYPSTISVDKYTGDNINANGTFKLTSAFKNKKPIYKNENDWFMWFNNVDWSLTNISVDDFTIEIKNGSLDPDDGDFTATPTPIPTPSPIPSPTPSPSPTPTTSPCILYINYDYSRFEGDSNNITKSYLLEDGLPVRYASGDPLHFQFDRIDGRTFIALLLNTGYFHTEFSNIKISTTSSTGPWTIPDVNYSSKKRHAIGAGNYYFTFDIPLPVVSNDCNFILPLGVPEPTTTTPTKNRRPIWTWSKVSGEPTSYDIQISSGGVLSSIVNQTELSFTPTNDLLDGVHTIKVWAKDDYGNTSAFGTHTVVIDNQPPPPVSSITTTQTSNRRPQWSWPAVTGEFDVTYGYYITTPESQTAGLLGDNMCGFSKNGNIYVYSICYDLPVGEVKFKVRVYDGAGNVSDWTEAPIKIIS